MAAEIVFTFSGTNHVIYAESVLLKAGLNVRIMPIPSAIRTASGCGMCLRLDLPQAKAAEPLLQEHNLKPVQIYIRTVENGKSVFSIYRGDNNGE